MNYKIGITFGGYCPMHQGHLECILKAKKECDVVFVVVCGYDNESRANEIGLPYEKRLEIIKNYFKNDEIINVIGINDTELGIDESMSFDNWHIWVNTILKQIYTYCAKSLIDDIYMYVGEKKYVEDISKLKFEHEIHPILVGYDKIRDKRINDISATDIRIRPQKHWSKITAPFRPYLTHKILITGTASEGKTTLVQDLEKYFQCPITTEYGRDYMSAKGITDPDLMFEDFLSFITGQNWYYKKALYSPANNGVIISDTDNLVTLMYAKAYAENPIMKITQDDYILLYECVKKLEGDIKWDKIFVFSPRNKFVDDGSRFMGQSSIDERQKNFDKLIKLLKDFNLMDKVEILDGDFFHNYNTIKTYISDLYQ